MWYRLTSNAAGCAACYTADVSLAECTRSVSNSLSKPARDARGSLADVASRVAECLSWRTTHGVSKVLANTSNCVAQAFACSRHGGVDSFAGSSYCAADSRC